LARHARVVVCGANLPIQQHDGDRRAEELSLALGNRAGMEGMVVFDYASRYAQAVSEIAA
jgi:NADPH-dependent curcumin reductase CurA